jgi:hypothetical protein
MAPERGEAVDVLNLDRRLDDSTLIGEWEVLERQIGGPEFEVFWHAEPLTENSELFWALGRGVAYVMKVKGHRGPIARDCKLPRRNDGRYSWNGSIGILVAVLPSGLTAMDVDPPAQAKEWEGRLALLWYKQGGSVTWLMDESGLLQNDRDRINLEFYRSRGAPAEQALAADVDAEISAIKRIRVGGHHRIGPE